MRELFQVPIEKPSGWKPPYVQQSIEHSEDHLSFRLAKDWDTDTYHYKCMGCLSAGGCIDDLFCTSSAEESEWQYGDGLPTRLVHEMFFHARQHEIMWRWAVNRIPAPSYDK